MARGPRKTIGDKIGEKEDIIASLQTRIKAEQKELDALYREKKNEDLESLGELINTSGLSVEEAARILKEYAGVKELETA